MKRERRDAMHAYAYACMFDSSLSVSIQYVLVLALVALSMSCCYTAFTLRYLLLKRKGSFFLAYTHHRAATLHALLRTCRAPSALE